MSDNTHKTTAAMLLELESIKGLLLEEDGIPILQEIMKQPKTTDVFDALKKRQEELTVAGTATEQLNTDHQVNEKNRASSNRPILTKAFGENPFLPEHIRSRLHGNNPPPSFVFETAKKIARSNRPTQLLGNTQNILPHENTSPHQQELIDSIMDSILPELEHQLRQRLQLMSKETLALLLYENNN